MQGKASRESSVHYFFDFAWVGVVAAAYAGFLGDSWRVHPEWQLWVCFACGALFAVSGMLTRKLDIDQSPGRLALVTTVQCVIAAGALFTSGLPGSFGLLTLPLVSQSAMVFRWPGVVLVTASMFCATIGAYVATYGAVAISSTVLPYGSAFVFTLLLSVAGRQAFSARAEAERLTQELTEANEQLRAQASHTDELATTRERNRLAREIHDGVGHYLTVIKVQLDAAAATLRSEPATAQHSIETAARLAAEALDDVRRSVGALRTEAHRPPLHQVLQSLAAQSQPVATVSLEGVPRPLAPATEHALFRTAQEGLTNIRKHARASTAFVRLDFTARNHVRLEVADDGVGFRPSAGCELAPRGFGIAGLRERLALLGGTIQVQERPDGGCILVAEVPA